MRATLSAKLQYALSIVWTWHKWDMTLSTVCTTSRDIFSSVFITQNGVTLNMLTWRKHFQEDKQPPCFSPLPDQTMLSWLSSTLVHSRITMNCQDQQLETTAVKKQKVLDCVLEFKTDFLARCRDTARLYSICLYYTVILGSVRPKLT